MKSSVALIYPTHMVIKIGLWNRAYGNVCPRKKKKRKKEKKVLAVSGHGSGLALCNEQTVSPKNPPEARSSAWQVI